MVMTKEVLILFLGVNGLKNEINHLKKIKVDVLSYTIIIWHIVI